MKLHWDWFQKSKDEVDTCIQPSGHFDLYQPKTTSKVKLNDYNKALSGRQPTIRYFIQLYLFHVISFRFHLTAGLKKIENQKNKKKNQGEVTCHRPMRQGRHRSTSRHQDRAIDTFLCRSTSAIRYTVLLITFSTYDLYSPQTPARYTLVKV